MNSPLHRQCGMTLLELTVVLLILVTLATVALRSTSGLQDQSRWEQTKQRYEAIRSAIIGDPKLTINGQLDISGFVADMGRLPLNIKELLSQNYCDNDYRIDTLAVCGAPNWQPNDDYFIGCSNGVSPTEAICTGAGATWHELEMGWNGPYLLSSEPSDEEDAFVDGWGNLPAVVTDLAYGWNFVPDANPATNLVINSTGCATCAAPYDLAYPLPATNPGVRVDDWLVDISGSGISITIQPNYSGSCAVTYTAPTCEIAGGAWSGTCTNVTYVNRYVCALNGEIWAHNGCSDGVSPDQATCTGAGGTWDTPCSDNIALDQATCEGGGGTWSPCPPVDPAPDSKALCETVNGTWTYNRPYLDLIISSRNGTGGVITDISTVTIDENGLSQQVNFAFPPGTIIPMGINNMLVTKQGTGDIYPPSCTGLNGDVGANGNDDCFDAGGTLLPNGLCDDITPAECLAGADGAFGSLTRDTQQIPFIPHKTLPIINW